MAHPLARSKNRTAIVRPWPAIAVVALAFAFVLFVAGRFIAVSVSMVESIGGASHALRP